MPCSPPFILERDKMELKSPQKYVKQSKLPI